MIVARLVMHNRNSRNALGAPPTASVFNRVATILVESYAIYAVNLLVYIGLWAARSTAMNIVSPLLACTQVRNIFTFFRRTATQGYDYLIL